MQSQICIKVRGYHLDLFGHVNNARYLEFLEEGRWDLIEKSTLNLDELFRRGLAFTVVNININYRRGARLGDMLRVKSELGRTGTKSAVIAQEITLKGTATVIADAEVTFVFIDTAKGVAVPIDSEILSLPPLPGAQ